MWDNSMDSSMPAKTAKPGSLRAWRWALAWMALIFVLSSVPGSAIPEVPVPQTDKLVHAVLYGVLGFLCARALAATTAIRGRRLVLFAALLATLYGVTDELHQLLTPRRSCDARDAAADAVGGLIGASLAVTLFRRRFRRPDNSSQS
jgi:VanZ family protein